MKNNLVLVAGSPATGKSYLVDIINDIYDNTKLIAPDEIKEMYADSVGFSDLSDKNKLEKKVWNFYYKILAIYMEVGKKIIISEYPFSLKQYDKLKILSQYFDYNVITIRLVADFETLWKRRYERDRNSNRHLSHIMTNYHYGDTLENREKADNHITKSEFRDIINNRRYNEFALGQVLEVDTTDFSEVDYELIKEFVTKNIQI